MSSQLAAGRVGLDEAASTLADLISVAARMVPGPAGQALRLGARAGDRARAQPGGGSPAPSPTAQAVVRTLAITGPTGQLVARLATAWRQVASAREQDGQVTSGTAAAAAAQAAQRAAGAEPSPAPRAPERSRGRGQDRDR